MLHLYLLTFGFPGKQALRQSLAVRILIRNALGINILGRRGIEAAEGECVQLSQSSETKMAFYTLCWRSPRSMTHWEDSQGSAYSGTHSNDLLQRKDAKQNQPRTVYRGSPEETGHKLPRTLSGWSHTGCPNSSSSKL